MDPNQAQLDARLNPTPYTFNIPVGFFKDAGQGARDLWYNPGNGQPLQFFETREANGAWNYGVDLANRFGLDYNSIPTTDVGAIRQQMQQQSPGGGWVVTGDPNSIATLKNQTPTGTGTSFTVNNTPNQLASAEDIAAARAAAGTPRQITYGPDGAPTSNAQIQAMGGNLNVFDLGLDGKIQYDQVGQDGREGTISYNGQTYGVRADGSMFPLGGSGQGTGYAYNSGGTGASGGASSGSYGSSGGYDPSGLPPQFQELYNTLEQYLKQLQSRGQVLNPNIEITPDQVANFTHQAETEINPYFANKLKIAREGFLRSAGYSADEIMRQEKAAEQKYKKNFRALGEEAADTGFAQSGRRIQAEGDLAQGTQESIDANRRKLSFDLGTDAREFAQQFGTSETPGFNLMEAPRVFGGETGFNQGTQQRALYELSPDVYNGLIGEQEFSRRGAVKTRASGLEEAFRSNQAIDQQRKLTL